MTLVRSIAALVVLLALATACNGDRPDDRAPSSAPSPDRSPLLVLAASDLEAVFTPLLARWHDDSDLQIEVVFGSSGTLAEQIRQGAPADLFFSADRHLVDDLLHAGILEPGSPTRYATGRLALVVPPGRDLPPGPEALSDPTWETIAIANPDHAPYGRAARQVFQTLGLVDTLARRLIPGEHIAHALHFVRSGNADAGIVALGLVEGRDPPPLPFRAIDTSLHAPLLQYAAIVDGSHRSTDARAFLDFVVSPEAQAIFAHFGFAPPHPSDPGEG